jgi:hypothetical protein
MTSPYPYDLSKLVYDRVRWTGIQEKEDYVFGQDYLVNGAGGYVTPLLNCEIPELREIKWLGSTITNKGNYVWHVNNLNQKNNNYLTFQ